MPDAARSGEQLVVAQELAEAFVKAIGGVDVAGAIADRAGADASLEGARYQHPFVADAEARQRLPAVVRRLRDRSSTGTGLVHTAPGHGADDYETGVAHGLAGVRAARRRAAATPTERAASSSTRQDDRRGEPDDRRAPRRAPALLLNPTDRQDPAQLPALLALQEPDHLPRDAAVVHRDGPRRAARDARSPRSTTPTWVPPWGEDRIYAMIENRPDWVLSRQRLWGTPIPAFYCTACGGEHADADTMEHVADDLREGGRRRVVDALGRRARARRARSAAAAAPGRQLEKEKDIVDVWFESGVSWLAMAASATPDYAATSTSTSRARDQHRGWFHSSLLAGIGVAGQGAVQRGASRTASCSTRTASRTRRATIEKARAARASKINYIEPDAVIKKSGAELFRLWVASTEFRGDIPYSRDDPRRRSPSGIASSATPRASCSATSRTSIPTRTRATTREARRRSLHARAARRGRRARAQGVRRVRAARRAPRCSSTSSRSTSRRSTATSPRIASTPTPSTRRRGARRRSCCTSACARSRRWRRRSSASPPRTSGSTCRAATAIRTRCTCATCRSAGGWAGGRPRRGRSPGCSSSASA